MATHRSSARALIDELLLGAWLGLIVLGGGGRAVMRGIALATDAPSALTVGGTVTVLAAGAAAFWPLVLVYGAWLLRALARRARRAATIDRPSPAVAVARG